MARIPNYADLSTRPTCRCGCGREVCWNSGKGWATYVRGHYVKMHGPSISKGGVIFKTNKSGTYCMLYMPDHPRASPNYVRRCIVVAEQKLGRPLVKGEVVHHINRIKTDDRPENLMVLSPSEHSLIHQREDGNPCTGTKHPLAKLNDEKVRDIRNRTDPDKDVAKIYGVSRDVIRQIRKRQRWKHVA